MATAETREPFLHIEETPIFFKEDWSTGIGGGLWSTGKAMAFYFRDHPHLIRRNIQKINCFDNIKGLQALELGSGNGLLSVCLAAVIRDMIGKLVVTDLEDHLDLMEKTVLANTHILNVDIGNLDKSKPLSEVKEHRWGEFDNCEMEVKFDFIFGSDVAYRDWLHEPLIKSLARYSHRGTISLIGVTMHDTKPNFFSLLKENGFTYQRIPDYQMAPEFRGSTFGLFVIQQQD